LRFCGKAYRAHDPRWAWSPVSGEGARLHGGRLNPKGTPALYLSLRIETAILEASQGFANRMPPLTLVEYDLDIGPLMDLTAVVADSDVARWLPELGCAWAVLATASEPVPTWQLADLLIKRRCAGIIVPSFAQGATAEDGNVVLWRWGDDLPERVVAFDPDGRLIPAAPTQK
jgi:RES domain-containing protein